MQEVFKWPLYLVGKRCAVTATCCLDSNCETIHILAVQLVLALPMQGMSESSPPLPRTEKHSRKSQTFATITTTITHAHARSSLPVSIWCRKVGHSPNHSPRDLQDRALRHLLAALERLCQRIDALLQQLRAGVRQAAVA